MAIPRELVDELLKGCELPEAPVALPTSVPRDREGSFEPELVKKGQTRIDGIDEKIIELS